MEAFGVKYCIVFNATIQIISANCLKRRDEDGNCTCSGYFYDKISDECKECPSGYIGQDCKIMCRYPGYGEQCQQECDCNAEYCNFRIGCINSIENSTNYNEENLSSGSVTVTERTTIITVVTIIVLALIFPLFLFFSKLLLIRRKTRRTAAQADTSASFEENNLHNVVDEFPLGVGPQNHAMEDVNPINEDLQMIEDENPTRFERNMEKKKTNTLKKNAEVTNIRETENIYTLAFASFGSVMMKMSVHDYSPLQFN
ncbi:uncharacterized protein LOC134275522 [Saccostrea cucullata]|uniref:uncharacterized protein LOC134275522 n=1 Tax=Saccostrea cuccullata TaxID=36930 RepID=UPI002ED67E97